MIFFFFFTITWFQLETWLHGFANLINGIDDKHMYVGIHKQLEINVFKYTFSE